MLDQQAKLQHAEQQLATGLRILKPSDDPVAAVHAVNLEGNLATIEQYARNAGLAEAELSLQDGVLASVNATLQRLRELTVQAANATNSLQSRQAIATEISARVDELAALGNTRDANGEYIFAGYSVGAVPFVDDGNGSISYAGDQGQRELQVGEGAQVAVRISGDELFLRVPTGNGTLEALASESNTGSLVVGRYGLNGSFVADNYTIDFSQATPSDPMMYSVSDGAVPPVVVASGEYQENQQLRFAGVQLSLSGVPADGDSISLTPSGNRSVFDTVSALAEALRQPAPDPVSRAQLQNSVNRALNDLDQGLLHNSDARAGIGARLNIVDSQRNINEDFQLHLQTMLSETRDIDYAEAISRFNFQLTSLQAAQKAYVQLQGLSLFQYL
jgi:flagellar hook-associated protein 3 FlgL